MDDRFFTEIEKINRAMILMAQAKAIRDHFVNPANPVPGFRPIKKSR
jgi:hypothetical protein